MKEQQLDALVFPTMSCVASPLWNISDLSYRCSATDPYEVDYVVSATGLPEVTVPAGTDSHGLPIGMSFLGEADGEQDALNLADAWQRISHLQLQPATTR